MYVKVDEKGTSLGQYVLHENNNKIPKTAKAKLKEVCLAKNLLRLSLKPASGI